MVVTVKNISGVKDSAAPLSADLFFRLRDDIVLGKLPQGYKLTEQDIGSQYKVSRTPVREALRQLEAEGLIETIPNRGAYVIGFSKQDLADMYQLRSAYEIQAVSWAIARITDKELDALEETFEFMEFYTMKNDIEKMLNINTSFHQIIYTASHNKMLKHLLSSYQFYIKLGSRNPQFGRDPTYDDTYLADVLDEHRAIFDAFQKKDVKAGADAMTIHMNNSTARHK